MNYGYKKLYVKVLCFAFALFVAIYATGAVFAWFSNQIWQMKIMGNTTGAYFAYGNGSAEKQYDENNEWITSTGPFGIANRTHLRNLALLQDMGWFNKEGDDQYHFELAGNIEMWDHQRNYVLPPIGNQEYPFIGVFEGNGHTIHHLVISTNKLFLQGEPAKPDYKFSNSVGLFGMTGGNADIGNFILDYPTVEVYDSTTYTTASDDGPAAVGLAVGYVAENVKVHSIGVMGGALSVKKTNYITFNSILGDLHPKAKEGKDGHNITGSGNNFGADFDAEGIVERLQTIAKNNIAYDKDGKPYPLSFRLPNVSEKNGSYGIAQLEKLPFTITSASTYTNTYDTDGNLIALAAEVVSPRNIGYILGNENAVHNDTVEFGKPLYLASNNDYYLADENGNSTNTKPNANNDFPIPQWFYKPKTQWGNYYNTGAFTALSEEEMQEIYEDAPDLIDYIFGANEDGSYTFESIQLGGDFSNNGQLQLYCNDSNSRNSGAWSPHGMIEWNGGTYGVAYERDTYAVDEHGYYYDGDNSGGQGYVLSGYLMEDDLLCFTLDESGKKIPTNITGTKVPIDAYEGGIALPNNGIWFRPANKGKIRMVFYTDVTGGGGGFQILKLKRPQIDESNPFAVNWSNGRHSGTGDIETIEYNNYVIARNILFYLDFDVTDADLTAGYEYWICNSQGSTAGAKFVYLDIGASGMVTDQADSSKQVTAIDFIYEKIQILDEDIVDETTNKVLITKGSFVDENKNLYIETATMLTFGGTGAIVCFYYRQAGQTSETAITIDAAFQSTDNKNTLVHKPENKKASITTNIPAFWTKDAKGVVNGDNVYWEWTLPVSQTNDTP